MDLSTGIGSEVSVLAQSGRHHPGEMYVSRRWRERVADDFQPSMAHRQRPIVRRTPDRKVGSHTRQAGYDSEHKRLIPRLAVDRQQCLNGPARRTHPHYQADWYSRLTEQLATQSLHLVTRSCPGSQQDFVLSCIDNAASSGLLMLSYIM